MKSTRTRIIGIGNPLMGDDGAGIAAIERLAARDLPDGVETVDGGTGGLTLLYMMENADHVIFVDAVAMNAPPGTIRLFTDQMLTSAAVETSGLSLHETGLLDVLTIARQMMASLPQISLYGIEPCSIEHRIGLSPLVEEAVDR
nr:hydrogenase maturation protease [Desulfuromonadales bacterium]